MEKVMEVLIKPAIEYTIQIYNSEELTVGRMFWMIIIAIFINTFISWKLISYYSYIYEMKLQSVIDALAAESKLRDERHRSLLAVITAERKFRDDQFAAESKLRDERHQSLLAVITAERKFRDEQFAAESKLRDERHQSLLAIMAAESKLRNERHQSLLAIMAAESKLRNEQYQSLKTLIEMQNHYITNLYNIGMQAQCNGVGSGPIA